MLGSGIDPRRFREHGLDNFEARDVDGAIHVQEHRGVAVEFLDAEIEHGAVPAVQFDGMLTHLEYLLGGDQLGDAAQVRRCS